MQRKQVDKPKEIIIHGMRDNQTWNDCPDCGKEWETVPSIPGIVHRTRLCGECRLKYHE